MFQKSLLFLLLLATSLGAWSAGRLRAEETSQKNFTTIRPEEMTQLENLHERGDSLMEAKNFRGALDVYSEILLIEPDDDVAYTNMAQAYLVLGDFRMAGDAFENALHINPDNDIARLGLRKIADPDFAPTEIKTVPVPLPTSAPSPAMPRKVSVKASISAPSPAPSTVPARASVPQPKTPPMEKAVLPNQPRTSDSIMDSKLSFNQWSQIALKNARLYNGAMDGKVTDSMKQAIEAFQKQNQLEIDGMVGPATWAKLKPYLKKLN